MIITASLINENDNVERIQLQVSNNDTDIHFTNKTEIKANKNEKYIFQTKKIFYGQLKGYFRKHQEFRLPQCSYLINNSPTVNFTKINNRWQPSLFSQDCIEVDLTMTSSNAIAEGEFLHTKHLD